MPRPSPTSFGPSTSMHRPLRQGLNDGKANWPVGGFLLRLAGSASYEASLLVASHSNAHCGRLQISLRAEQTINDSRMTHRP